MFRPSIMEHKISLLKVVHEEDDRKTGKYFFIGEFEITSPPPKPEVF